MVLHAGQMPDEPPDGVRPWRRWSAQLLGAQSLDRVGGQGRNAAVELEQQRGGVHGCTLGTSVRRRDAVPAGSGPGGPADGDQVPPAISASGDWMS